MIDSHAHLYFDRFDGDREEVLRRAQEAGVEAIINIGIDADTSNQALELTSKRARLFTAVGIHPTSRVPALAESLERVALLARTHPKKVVALGEIGLDYHWNDVPPEEQKPRLDRQLELALELGLPVIFHCRDALNDLLERLEAATNLPAGVFHCFSGGPTEAQRALDLGFHVSFAGNVTYPKHAENLRDAARHVPLERLLLETDSPFLPPQPKRGRRNEPAFLLHSRDFLAQLKDVPAELVERVTTENAVRLFGLEM